MLCLEYDRFGRAEDVSVIRERPAPIPRANEVLVRVRAAALNPKDVLVRKGKFVLLSGRNFPRQMGYDLAGEVHAVGRSVRSLREGDAVFGMLNRWRAGAVAEYCAVPASELCKKPATLGWEDAAALPLTTLTALQALRDEAELKPGQRVLINGASGGVGVAAIQIAKALGADVTSVCSAPNRELVEALGSDAWLDHAAGDVFGGESRFDVVFDVFGNQTLARAARILHGRGRYVSTVPSPRVIVDSLLTRFARQRAGMVKVRSRTRDLTQIAELVLQGKLRAVVHGVYTLAEAVEAQHQIESKHSRGKVVIRI